MKKKNIYEGNLLNFIEYIQQSQLVLDIMSQSEVSFFVCI